MLLKRTEPIIEKNLTDNQMGFRKNKGTKDAIFMLRTLQERCIEKQKNIFICFVDYTKAFDRVNHEKLVEILNKVGIPKRELRLIVQLCKNQKAHIRDGNIMTDQVTIEKGVRQGCILSPCLFNIYSETVIQEALNHLDGININGERISNIRYADDTALLAESQEQLQKMITKINNSCKKFGMSLNAKKTKVMIVEKKESREQLKIHVDGTELEQVYQYSYLGSLITTDGRCIREVKKRIIQAKEAFWKNKEVMRGDINLDLKLRLLKCYVYSIVSYAAETWTFSKEMKKRIRAFEMWTYRRILKISWTEKVKNEVIKERLNLKNREDLATIIARRKLAYAGHVMRGSSGKLLLLTRRND